MVMMLSAASAATSFADDGEGLLISGGDECRLLLLLAIPLLLGQSLRLLGGGARLLQRDSLVASLDRIVDFVRARLQLLIYQTNYVIRDRSDRLFVQKSIILIDYLNVNECSKFSDLRKIES